MRYQEAYELIDIGIVEGGVAFPVSPALKEIFFDQIVENIGLRAVKKRDYESFTTSGKDHVFTKHNISDQIYKVELSKSDVPFVPESAIISDIADSDVSKIGYYLKTDTSTGSITAGTRAVLCEVTSVAHGLDTGDYVIFSEVDGLNHDTTKVNALNGKRLAITKVSADAFTININTNADYDSVATSGFWQEDTKKIYLTKTPDSGGTLNVFYYAKPEPKNNITSRIDLPNQLIPAAIHRTLAHFLDIGGNLQIGSGHRGLAEKLEQEYVDTARAREPMPHIVPSPMQSFTTARNGSLGNLTGADN